MFFHVRYLISNQQLTEYYVIFLILHRKNSSFDTLEFVRTLIVSTDDPISDSSLIALMTATSNCPLKLLFTLNSEHFQFFLPLFLHYHHSPPPSPPSPPDEIHLDLVRRIIQLRGFAQCVNKESSWERRNYIQQQQTDLLYANA